MEFPRDSNQNGRSGNGKGGGQPISGVYFTGQQHAGNRMSNPVVVVDRSTGTVSRVQVPVISPSIELIDLASLSELNRAPGVTLVSSVPLQQKVYHHQSGGVSQGGTMQLPRPGLVSQKTATMKGPLSRLISQSSTTRAPRPVLVSRNATTQELPSKLTLQRAAIQSLSSESERTTEKPSSQTVSRTPTLPTPPLSELVSQSATIQHDQLQDPRPSHNLYASVQMEPPPTSPGEEEDCEEIYIRMGSGLGAAAYRDFGKFPPRPVSMMRFSHSNMDPVNWSKCKMIRDMKRSNPEKPTVVHSTVGTSKTADPKTGGGSTYGAQDLLDFRERNKLRKYKKKAVIRENQPWLIKLFESCGDIETNREIKSKCFKGTKEGGISQHASYFIFIEQKTEEKVFEAYPINNWFDFKLINSYQNFTAEEAEEKFRKRNDTYNFFSLMTKKRLNKGAGDTSSDEETSQLESAKKKIKLGSSTEDGGRKPSLGDWTDSSDDEGTGIGIKKKRGKVGGGGLINSYLDDADNEEEIDFMSSSEFSSSSDDDADPDEDVRTKVNPVDLLNSSSQSEFGSQQST